MADNEVEVKPAAEEERREERKRSRSRDERRERRKSRSRSRDRRKRSRSKERRRRCARAGRWSPVRTGAAESTPPASLGTCPALRTAWLACAGAGRPTRNGAPSHNLPTAAATGGSGGGKRHRLAPLERISDPTAAGHAAGAVTGAAAAAAVTATGVGAAAAATATAAAAATAAARVRAGARAGRGGGQVLQCR